MHTSRSPFSDGLLEEIRARFLFVDEDPVAGRRIFFENGGGSLVLRSVVEAHARFMSLPDSSRRDNATSASLLRTIESGLAHVRTFFGASAGTVAVGMTGTDSLFRLARTVLVASARGSAVSSALEHASSHDATEYWAGQLGHEFREVPIDTATGSLRIEDYLERITDDTRIATIVHTSHVTGRRIEVASFARAIKSKARDCFVVVDGIQHAPHGPIAVEELGADAYVFSPYKAFSARGHSFAWLSDRLGAITHEKLKGKPNSVWDLGSRAACIYAGASAVHEYLLWLGGHLTKAGDDRARLVAAMQAAHDHETFLIDLAINGSDDCPGLKDIAGASVLGGDDLEAREGAVSFALQSRSAAEIVRLLGDEGIRTHFRGSGADSSAKYVMKAFGMDACVRASFGHYNTGGEVKALLRAVRRISAAA